MAGDNDAILVLLLIPRLMAKCELLMTQIREKVYQFIFQHSALASRKIILHLTV